MVDSCCELMDVVRTLRGLNEDGGGAGGGGGGGGKGAVIRVGPVDCRTGDGKVGNSVVEEDTGWRN